MANELKFPKWREPYLEAGRMVSAEMSVEVGTLDVTTKRETRRTYASSTDFAENRFDCVTGDEPGSASGNHRFTTSFGRSVPGCAHRKAPACSITSGQFFWRLPRKVQLDESDYDKCLAAI